HASTTSMPALHEDGTWMWLTDASGAAVYTHVHGDWASQSPATIQWGIDRGYLMVHVHADGSVHLHDMAPPPATAGQTGVAASGSTTAAPASAEPAGETTGVAGGGPTASTSSQDSLTFTNPNSAISTISSESTLT